METLRTLQPGESVSSSIINLYLLTEWYKCQENCPSYYVDMSKFQSLEAPEEAEIHEFWSLYLLKEAQATLEYRPVIFIMKQNNHYFTTCFDFQTCTAWVFGKWVQAPELTWTRRRDFCCWDDWGPRRWIRVAALFRWIPSTEPVRVVNCDFPQVNTVPDAQNDIF
jgi:hypothetical protein